MTAPGSRHGPLGRLTLTELRQRTGKKWVTYAADVLPLWIADMDVLLAEPVAEAIYQAVARGDTGQPAGTQCAEAFARFASVRWNWKSIDPGATARLPSVMRGMADVTELVTATGDYAVLNSPVYPPFYAFARNAGRQVLEAPLTRDGRIDPASLEEAFKEATRQGRQAVYMLCSPHNPTGAVHTLPELTAVAALADRYGVRVIANEVHAPLTLPGATFIPYLTVAGDTDGFTVTSAAKGWNLAGFKAAIAIPGALARDDLARLPAEVQQGASHVALIAHAAAYNRGATWLDELILDLDQNRSLLADLLSAHLPAVTYTPPEASYLAWLDCRRLLADVAEAPEPAAFFVEQARVALNPGVGFGTGGAGRVRLNFATSEEILTEAVRRIARATQLTER